MTEVEAKELCDRIRQIAYELHVYLGVGYLEKVYENGLKHRLEKAGFAVKTQVPLQVRGNCKTTKHTKRYSSVFAYFRVFRGSCRNCARGFATAS